MPGIYVYSDKPALVAELVGFGKAAWQPTFAITFDDTQSAALAQCGADGIVQMQGDADLIENNAKPLAAFLAEREADMLVVGATATGRDLAARVAGYLDCAMASDATTLSFAGDHAVVSRMMYGGAVVAEGELPLPAVVTIGAGRFDKMSGVAPVEKIVIAADQRARFQGSAPIVKEGADLSKAKAIVSFGMGVGAQEDMQMIQALADTIGAELGCTRGIAEERHWLPIEQYVGLSGVDVAPNLYLTLGISGQVQHLAGMRDSKLIVAVDKNPQAPIFKACDYGIVGDLYEVVPLLTEALANQG